MNSQTILCKIFHDKNCYCNDCSIRVFHLAYKYFTRQMLTTSWGEPKSMNLFVTSAGAKLILVWWQGQLQ